jgi:DNA-binding NarL/FixJ family response regulator
VLLDDLAPDAGARKLLAGASGVLHRGAEPVTIARALVPRREKEILEQLARDASYGRIARTLGPSTETIRNHMSSTAADLEYG